MSDNGLIMRGIRGLVTGHVVFLQAGFEGSMGRSRRSDVCLKDSPGYIQVSSTQTQDEQHFKTTSRKHILIRIGEDQSVFIKDTSTNGTFLNTDKVDEKTLQGEDLKSGDFMLRLGTTETFQLDWGETPLPDEPATINIDEKDTTSTES